MSRRGIPTEVAGRPVLYLKSEELIISEEPVIITTVLGSCIAVSMYHEKTKIGALCHALLPVCKEAIKCKMCCHNKYKYVACVIPEMVNRLIKKGVNKKELVVKLFGGSDMKMLNRHLHDYDGVGRKNAQVALETISYLGLKPVKKDVGGIFGRKLYFFTDTGRVLLKRLGE